MVRSVRSQDLAKDLGYGSVKRGVLVEIPSGVGRSWFCSLPSPIIVGLRRSGGLFY